MSEKSHTMRGLRAIAIFEAVKAVLIFAVGFGLFSLINHDVGSMAETTVTKLHLNPFNKYPQLFLEAAQHVTNAHLVLFASLAMIDAFIRGAVAYGLWFGREWGKWLGVVSAGIYIPIEIYEMYIHFTALKLATFVTNIAIVIYLGLAIYWERQSGEVPSNAPNDGS